MTSDGRSIYRIQKMTETQMILCNDDVECETGGGIVPLEYKENYFSLVGDTMDNRNGVISSRERPLEYSADARSPQCRTFFLLSLSGIRFPLPKDRDYRELFY